MRGVKCQICKLKRDCDVRIIYVNLVVMFVLSLYHVTNRFSQRALLFMSDRHRIVFRDWRDCHIESSPAETIASKSDRTVYVNHV
jgi:hypothetical protein